MKKRKKNNIAKEVIIMLLLAIIILLVMIVALYDFRPSNVVVPETIKYSSDAKTTLIKQEINYTNGGDLTADGNIDSVMTSLKSYSIEASDLSLYGQKNLYNSGNSNPFEYVQEETATPTGDGSTSTPASDGSTTNNSSQQVNTSTSTTTTTTNNNQASGSSTTGTFFESKSSK